MKLPRGLSGETLVRRLARLGYRVLRRHGSHAVLETDQAGGHLCFVAMHDSIKPGTLGDTLKDVAQHHGLSMDELLRQLDLR